MLLRPHRVTRLRRYLRYRKAQRLLRLAEDEMSQCMVAVRARPVYMNLDIGPLCNLQCRFCCTANGISTLKRELMQPDVFERIVQQLPLDSLYEVQLFNWGEPLLNPHLLDYIRFFAEKGIWTVIHTNFSVRDHDEAFMESLVRSGIGEVTVSVDGASQEVYEKYRVGGDLRRVIANMDLLARTRERLNSDTPNIVYKMLVHRYNEHEVDAARAIAQSLGVAFLLQENLGTPDDKTRAEWTAPSVRTKFGDAPISSSDTGAGTPVLTECRQMWHSLVVNADGAVFPCCLVCAPEHAVGNLTTQTFEEIWNGGKMRTLRRHALNAAAEAPIFPNACAGCPFRLCVYRQKVEEVAQDTP